MVDVSNFVNFLLTDVGRFAPNFKFGFQLRTLSPSALLLYIEDAFALQVVDGEVCNDQQNHNIMCVCVCMSIEM